ncbi:MAG: HNH endonuclease [Planctomycetota bacterium]|jgi:hypothetical protein
MCPRKIIIPSKTCIYCGSEIRKIRKGEHVVPEALGGRNTIRRVCNDCNNGELSILDNVLMSQSPLHMPMIMEMTKKPAEIWDCNNEYNIVTESRLSSDRSYTILWPQAASKFPSTL